MLSNTRGFATWQPDMGTEGEWDLEAAIQFVLDNSRKNVALQFPHDLISIAHNVLFTIKEGLLASGWSGKVRSQSTVKPVLPAG